MGDQFNFNSWKLSGDGSVTARILSITNTSFYAKAGVMFREASDAGSAHAFASALPGASAYQYRAGAGNNAAGSPYYPVAYPFWVRLRSEEHTSELQSHLNLVCRLLLEKKK